MASAAAHHSRTESPLRPMLIDGKPHAATGPYTIAVHDPATGEVIAHIADAAPADVDAAVAAARRTFEQGAWRAMSGPERAKVLWRIADLIEARAEEIAALEVLDNGMPLLFARAGAVATAAGAFRYFAGWCTKINGIARPLAIAGQDFHAYTEREPVGVAALIVPWNFPFANAALKLAPALAAGCSCVLKPAEQTPLSALLMGEILHEAGVPAGVVNIVTGYGRTAGAALAAHPDVDKLSFTGSTATGKAIVQASVGNLKRLSLELGGKSPMIVFEDADLERVVPGAANAIFFNSGQVCIAGSRLYVQKSIFDKVVDGIAAHAKAIKVGNGMDEGVQMGPLVSQAQLERVTGYIESGLDEGAELVTGGNRIGERGYFVEPTILVNTRSDMRVVREEIFGPVLVAMPVEDLDTIADIANASEFGLGASIWTNTLGRAHRLARKLRAGNVWINNHMMVDMSMPFGGFKQSGWGRENGEEGIGAFLETKSIIAAL